MIKIEVSLGQNTFGKIYHLNLGNPKLNTKQSVLAQIQVDVTVHHWI